MAARKRKSSKAASREPPGWVWLLFGLSLGLVVAAAVYVSDRRGQELPARILPADVPVSQIRSEPAAENTTGPAHPAARFDFFDILPRYEVVIPEVESQPTPDRQATAVGEPGRYVLQAGSFKEFADADRMKASLGLLGIESRIQRVTIDTDEFHRVRIGPISDLDELNGLRRRLWDAEIEILMLNVPD